MEQNWCGASDDKLAQVKQFRETFAKQQKHLHTERKAEIDGLSYSRFLRDNAIRQEFLNSKIKMMGK